MFSYPPIPPNSNDAISNPGSKKIKKNLEKGSIDCDSWQLVRTTVFHVYNSTSFPQFTKKKNVTFSNWCFITVHSDVSTWSMTDNIYKCSTYIKLSVNQILYPYLSIAFMKRSFRFGFMYRARHFALNIVENKNDFRGRFLNEWYKKRQGIDAETISRYIIYLTYIRCCTMLPAVVYHKVVNRLCWENYT